jgi:hypothetical protein
MTVKQERPAYGPFLDRDFAWGPPRGELAWLTLEETRYLTTGAPGLMAPVRRRRPLEEHPALFKVFAALEPTTEAILAFALEWGLLGAAHAIPATKPADEVKEWLGTGSGSGRVPAGRGESLDRWGSEIRAMREAVQVWDAVVQRDVACLGKVIQVEQSPGQARAWFESSDRGTRSWRGIYDEGLHVDLVHAALGAARDRRSSLLRAALFFVQKVVNQKLAKLSNHVSPSLVYTCAPDRLALLDPKLNRKTRARLVAVPFKPDEERLRVGVSPRTLLGALWLQFARAVDGGFKYITCEACGAWIEVAPTDGRRQRRRFCRDTCRVNWSRRKDRSRLSGDRPRRASRIR